MVSKFKLAGFLSILILAPYLSGCGVKGDPLPPERPPELGRGRPTYRRATEKIKVQKPEPVEDDEPSDTEDGE